MKKTRVGARQAANNARIERKRAAAAAAVTTNAMAARIMMRRTNAAKRRRDRQSQKEDGIIPHANDRSFTAEQGWRFEINEKTPILDLLSYEKQ